MPKKRREIAVRIDSWGAPFCSLVQEPPLEIPFGYPNDLVRTELVKKRSNVWQGKLLEILEPGAGRIPPRCPHFTTCGGCSAQHVSYEEQLLLKERFLHTLIEVPQGTWLPILPSPILWHYRNKMEFSFSQDKAGNYFSGLMQAKSHKVLNLDTCYLGAPCFVDALKRVRQWQQERKIPAYNPRNNEGTLRTLTLRHAQTTGGLMAILTVSGRAEYALHTGDLEAFKALFPPTTALFLRIQQAIEGQPTQFYEMHLQGPDTIEEKLTVEGKTLSFFIGPSSFFQPNTLQAITIYSRALQMAQIKPHETVCDLFCGTGTIGLFAASMAKQVIGVEIVPEALLDARENAKRENISNISFIEGAVGTIPLPKTDLIFIDPPRAGLEPKALEAIASMGAQRIVYISCQPKSQKRDLLLLQEKGYHITQLQPIDQFPHTPHIENLALLVRR